LRVPGRELIADGSFAIERGEHVALVGPNGSGKSTLLETIVGARRPDDGELRTGHGVVTAYFSRTGGSWTSAGACSIARLARRSSRAGRRRRCSGASPSRPGRAGQAVAALSGGERRRLALAIVVASGANFLVLDERRTT